MHCIPEYYTQKHIIHTFKPVIIDRTGTYLMIYYNNNIPLYEILRREKDEWDENGNRPPADITFIVERVCVCYNYDLRHGNSVAVVVAAKESSQPWSRFDFGRRAADRFSTIYLSIFFHCYTRHRFGVDENLFVCGLIYYYHHSMRVWTCYTYIVIIM